MTVVAAPTVRKEPLGAELAALAAGLEPGQRRWVVVAGPEVAPRGLLELFPGQPGVLWESPQGEQWCGVGVAAELHLESGDRRFSRARQWAEQLFASLSEGATGEPAVGLGADIEPRVFGGFSFGPTPAGGSWSSFGTARFVLPRLGVRRTADGCEWWLVLDGDTPVFDTPGAGEVTIDDLLQLFELAREGRWPSATSDANAVARRRRPRSVVPERWQRQMQSALRGIHDGTFEKVVLARHEELRLRSPARLPELMQSLAALAPESTRFLFEWSGVTLLGATPERLISRDGAAIATAALAGSLRRSRETDIDDLAARLLASGKDRHEHDLVVRHLVERLQPLCAELEVPVAPDIRQLRHILHLETAIEGRLHRPRHILELVAELHPTPAVGGRPVAPAMQWIEAQEGAGRGWYAGPVGWFDRHGCGDFHVALRSVLLHDQRALMFAGAGVVADSSPDAEFAETEDKLAVMHALLDASSVADLVPVPADESNSRGPGIGDPGIAIGPSRLDPTGPEPLLES